ncbi:hypothetical protein ACIOEX_06630 [Streptomyces sp. NPDC087850]|uniref:hypothetical protein n=1 Tax=Streptomyces sp. NPDC087850 TaxID=3365809 RepID=UPI0037FF3B86
MVRQGGVRAGWPARGWVEAHGYVSIDAARFGRRVARGGARWETVRGLGRRAAAVQTAPSTGPPVDVQHLASAPELRYRSVLAGAGTFPVGGLPAAVPGRARRPPGGRRTGRRTGGRPVGPGRRPDRHRHRWPAALPPGAPGAPGELPPARPPGERSYARYRPSRA